MLQRLMIPAVLHEEPVNLVLHQIPKETVDFNSQLPLKEMHSQVGDLDISDGIATRGLLIRHLVMPGRVEDTKRILNFIADEISDKSYVNVMPQYRPVHRARGYPDIDRRVSGEEFNEAVSYASRLGLRLD